jgi:hypothetical protein
MPKQKYALEARYAGQEPPWEGWRVIRTYQSEEARDRDLRKLRDNGSQWEYRVKQR